MLFISKNFSLKLFQKIHKCNAVIWNNYSSELKTQIRGQTINYLKVGNGEKKVLCFPGALGTIWSDFKPQIEGLDQSKFTIVAWDPPGYGSSRPPNRKFDRDFYEADADCAYYFMKEIGIEKYSLLGWSDGGISSLILSAKYPKNVENLVVWGANAYVTEHDIRLFEKIRDLGQWSDKMKAPLIKLYTEEGLCKMWNAWCDTMVDILKNKKGDICKNHLKDIQCPTLIVHGNKDPLVVREHAEYLLKHIKDAKLHTYPDGKHNLHLKYAKDFNSLISDFLRK